MSVNPVYYAYSGTIQGDRGVYDTEATLFQLFHNGTRSPVGTIRDHLLALDIRDTAILCFGKELFFHALYDTPILTHSTSSFCTHNGGFPVELHSFWMSGQHFLEHDGHLYPVTASVIRSGERWELAIYDSSFSEAGNVLSHPLIGEIIVRKNQNRFACNVRIDKELPAELAMAIVSLPFTYNILPG